MENIGFPEFEIWFICGELVDEVFSTMTITTFKCPISTIDADSVDRRHTSFPEMTKTFITNSKEYAYVSGWTN